MTPSGVVRTAVLGGIATLASCGLGGLGLVLPIHPYAWAESEDMSSQVSADAVLTVMICTGLGFCLALFALILGLRLGRASQSTHILLVGGSLTAMLVCALRFGALLPVYSG